MAFHTSIFLLNELDECLAVLQNFNLRHLVEELDYFDASECNQVVTFLLVQFGTLLVDLNKLLIPNLLVFAVL